MNREILFRGKSLSNGEWVYGFYTQGGFIDPNTGKEAVRHIIDNGLLHDVASDTVGEFTGMCDKHGNKIFEGDIVEVYDFASVYASKYRGVVKMYRGFWCVKYEDLTLDLVAHPRLFFDDFADRKTEVVGNIYDNQELLNKK